MLNEIDLSRTDLNLLVLFEVVLEERHVGRAADRLNLTPSAVSHGLGRLRRLLNDPLFLRTPKGVVPTARATELSGPVADVLARARSVISTAEPFDPATSTRRFTIGAAGWRVGGVAAAAARRTAQERARRRHQHASAAPDAGGDPHPSAPGASPSPNWKRARWTSPSSRSTTFRRASIGERSTRRTSSSRCAPDIRSRKRPTLDRYCEMQHLVVSHAGDAHGFVDEILAGQGQSRRIALTVPNFMFALAVVAETDLISALPRRFAAMHAPRFGVVTVEAPLPLAASGSTRSLRRRQ